MLIVLPFCQGDLVLFRQWLKWCERLGGCKGHIGLLVADAGVMWDDGLECLAKAKKLFDSATIITPEISVVGWPAGPNLLFKTAAKHIARKVRLPWFWCEPDAIPLKPGWATMIEASYWDCAKPFYGAVVPCSKPNLPAQHLNGNAVYPANAYEVLKPFLDGNAWDVMSAAAVVPQACDRGLIQHFYGEERLAPTFLDHKPEGCPINAFKLDVLKPEAAVFHRNKDGTLIRLLWRKLFPGTPLMDEFIVVLPFCNKDAGLAIKNARWMAELGHGEQRFDCLMHYDNSTIKQYVAQMKAAVSQAFRSVQMYTYPAPKNQSWPWAPNWAFQNAARYVATALKRPWLWLEYDAIPLKRTWVEGLQNAYSMCGKRFFGPIVPGMGHMNGVGVYPEDAPARLPTAMAAAESAWDAICRKDMGDDVHDASDLIQHVWGLWDGKPHPSAGQPISFRSRESMQAVVSDKALLYHRNKDGSLIDRLREIHR